MTWVIGAGVVVASLLAGGAVSAKPASYAQHQDLAKKLARQGDRRGAIREFEKAYAIDHTPDALFNIGVLYKNIALSGGTREEAQRSLDSLTAYLRRHRELHAADPADQITVERWSSELREKFA